MKGKKNIRESAKETILIEADAIAKLADLVDIEFENAVRTILDSKGRVIVTGIGKSANIATKIVATLNSTGTPAVFMHAADAIHGDLGNIQQSDVVICISKSGNTPEIKVLLPLIKNSGNTLFFFVSVNTGNREYIIIIRCHRHCLDPFPFNIKRVILQSVFCDMKNVQCLKL